MDVHSSHIEGVGDFTEFLPGTAPERIRHIIEVPEGASAIALGVGDIEGDSFRSVLTANVRVRYVGDRGPKQVVDNTRDTDTESALVLNNGVVAYVNLRPSPGKWEIVIQHSGEAAFSVNVSVFVRPLRAVRAFANKHKCKACKVGVRAALYAVLAKLAAGAIAFIGIKALIARLANGPTAFLHFLANACLSWPAG